ncbi:MAG: hypothetical protein A4E61_00974 [Syntrophorhabdus sp. PtaB.Bin184]|nr:MAG: hypothetical protein A4E61_00974 [Syntrophorhabdus sp. PtaB.Bin184]
MKTNDRMKSYAVTVLKLCFAALIIYYMVATGKLDLAQISQILHKKTMIFKIVLALLTVVLLTTTRWYYLLLWQGITTTFKAVLRINCIGMFFNSFMPGALGGDLVKAFYIAKDNRSRKVGAVMTILIDRIIGFQAIIIVAFVALFFNHKIMMSNHQLQVLAFAIAFYIACSFVAAACVFSKRVKNLFISIGVKKLVYRLPKKEFLLKTYDAFHVYAHQKTRLLKAVGITILIDILNIYMFYVIGRDMGENVVSLTSYLTAIPIGILMLSLPVAPAGIGVGQVAFYNLFLWFGARSGSIGATIVTVYQMIAISLSLSFVFVYLGNRKEVRKAVMESTGDALPD